MNVGWSVLAVVVAGGLGAVLRHVVDVLIPRPGRRPYPLGTMIVNLTGSAALGLVAGAVMAGRLPEWTLVVLGSGLLGGYTTFSSASQESVDLLREDRPAAGLLHSGGMLVGAVVLAGGGLWLGQSL